MSRNRWHVVPRGDRWGVHREGAQRDSAVKDTKAEAEQRAKEIARNQGGGEVVPHGRSGQFGNPNTIDSNDPCPPKDTKR